MSALEEAMDIGVVTTEQIAEEIAEIEAIDSAGIISEVPKSPRTPRPKKDKQAMISVRVLPINPLRTKLTMEEKGKAINLEADEEGEFEEILVEEEDVEMEVET